MKRLIPLILALLLCGCASGPAPEVLPATEPVPATAPPAPAVSIYDAGSALENATNGAIRVYPLGRTDCSSVAAMGGDFLVFSGSEGSSGIGFSAQEERLSTMSTESRRERILFIVFLLDKIIVTAFWQKTKRSYYSFTHFTNLCNIKIKGGLKIPLYVLQLIKN